METTIQDLLAPSTVVAAISQLDLPGSSLQKLFGWGLSGTNKQKHRGREFAYDIFNHTRKVATARGPGQASARTSPQSIGKITGAFPRAAETISLLDEDLLNRRALGESGNTLDAMGQSYVTRQEAYLAQRFVNLVELQTAAMLRGKYGYTALGDDLIHGFGNGDVTVDFQIPDSHRGQLDMLGEGNLLDADWADPQTDIPGHLQDINAALVQRCGMGLSHVVLTGIGWQHVVNNEVVQDMGGSTNQVYASLERASAGEFRATLRALPWVTFHVVDYGLEVFDGSEEVFTKLVEDDHAAFLPEISPRWTHYLEGSEIVTDGPGGNRAEQYGFYATSYATHDPSGWNLMAVMNGIPALTIPEAVAYGQISGGMYA
ncbi:major capsid protein [Bremerella sp. T1]|uniref:major capsid protein n=1 Tax=Bremerella sp. TYQ1 TaxID=3119568 RepID=UPI001CCD67FC|nr:major capsid protein [Bremerella volcania]UBM34505.1 major capsid protein [Bremerella volcania]